MEAGGAANGQGIVEREGERLFDHDRDAVLGGDFDGVAVFADGGVDQHGLGMAHLDHVGHGFEKQALGERVFLPDLGGQSGVGFGNAHQIHILVPRQGGEKALDMAVGQADDGHPEGRRRGLLGRGQHRQGHGHQQSQQAHAGGAKGGTKSGAWHGIRRSSWRPILPLR